jgi:uncharacterized protein YbcV (DUF1398 family)
MFTIQQIEEAHSKVKSGADFPQYIQDIKKLGVIAFETFVVDSHTKYIGKNDFCIESQAIYKQKSIAEQSNKDQFSTYLKSHQRGETDYFQFCDHCAETGVEKWIVDLEAMTCTYYDKSFSIMLTETIPTI